MRKFLLILLAFAACTPLGLADTFQASLVEVRHRHHVQRHHTHKAGKHKMAKHHRYRSV